MKEVYFLIIALLAASFIVNIRPSDDDWILYRGELRMWEMHAEADSLRARSLIFARSFLDSWLYRMNGSACYQIPPSPNGSIFLDMLEKDWSRKGFHYKGFVSYAVFRAEGGQESDPLFGGLCRDGGIGISVRMRLELLDDLLGLEASRNLETEACQPTAYFLLRDVLSLLESRTSSIVRSAFARNDNVSEALKEIKEELRMLITWLRSELMERGVKIRMYYYTKFIPLEGREDIVIPFRAILYDTRGEFIHMGKVLRGFYCIREWEIRVSRS
ncbi:MAG TPA: hypothetical protein ENF57_03740 [Candidatus Korarchaeota archaeon]|nr:hypothetical protein [Candidatus Korarchaeota archaeon]